MPVIAAQLVIHAKIVLDGDCRQGLVFLTDAHTFLGLNRLVESVGPAPTGHQAAGEFVNNNDLAVLDHIIDIALEQGVGPQGLVDVVQGADFRRIVQVFDPQDALDLGYPLLGQGGVTLFFVNRVIEVFLQPGDDPIQGVVFFGRFLGRTGG